MGRTKSHEKDWDVRRLTEADTAIRRTTTPKMRKAALEYLWDKYVTNADKLKG